MNEMTKKQQKVYDYLIEYLDGHGYPPSVRDICSALGFRSPSTAQYHLNTLVRLGYIKRESGKGRATVLTKKAEEIKGIPVLGRVAAGTPILAEESVEEYLPYTAGERAEDCFGLRVRGFSMKNAGILPDDIVVVKKQSTAENGEIVVALLEDEATVKRLHRDGKKVWLMPENEEFSPIDGTNCEILGRVIAVVRRY